MKAHCHKTVIESVNNQSFTSCGRIRDDLDILLGQFKLKKTSPNVALLDRDHSILAFNERVLDWAHREDVPLLERLRYLCIVSSNLDEFFEVRAEPHLVARQHQDQNCLFTVEAFERLSNAAHTLVARQYALYNDDLMPALAKHG